MKTKLIYIILLVWTASSFAFGQNLKAIKAGKMIDVVNGTILLNQIILIDIGELPDDTEIIARQIQDRPWTKEYVTSGLKESEVREYFIAEMDKAFLST